MGEHDGYPGAPPGWYPDPAGGTGQRWWDGYAWTQTVLPQPPPPPPAGQAAHGGPWALTSQRLYTVNTGTLVDAELRMTGIARIAVAVPAACALASLVINRFNSARWLAAGHQFRLDWHAAQNGTTPPPYHGPGTFTGANAVVSMLFVAGAIVALIWQHRAASAAQALGLPAGQSPAWGVGSWFVPIVNFWIPYLAVRDCLPAGDPHRARVLQWWLAWLGSSVLGTAVAASALFSSGTALVLSVPAALTDLAIVVWAPGIVTAIGATHRETLVRRAQTAGAMGSMGG